MPTPLPTPSPTPTSGGLLSGATRWVQVLSTSGDDRVWGVGADRAGEAFLLWFDGAAGALRLGRASASTTTLLGSFNAAKLQSAELDVGPDEALYLGATGQETPYPYVIDLGGGPQGVSQIARFGLDGRFASVVDRCGLDCERHVLAVSARGDVVVAMSGAFQLETDLIRADGARLPLFANSLGAITGPLADMGCWAAAFGPDGNPVCGGITANGAAVMPGLVGQATFAGHPAVAKLDLAGRVLWRQALGVTGLVTGLGTSALGTVVAAGAFTGKARFGTDDLDRSGGAFAGFLATIEANGAPRWARQLDDPALELAVDPAGRAAVCTEAAHWPGGTPAGASATLRYYDLAGALHWTRPLPPRLGGLAIRAGDVLMGGTWLGSFDFGAGLATSSGDDAYLLDVAP
ncbi:hypothetical protein [Anaeromyxobacter paludicola]|uniref:Uncharacterized protein n=1 Tax=Anaeromyxobacter paludicola TaxID=2918171 RepID=A0ABN6N9U3_9BACT|nr:hypothetical protein [Anaeromyxobacter paludicola]BDG09999.1 hypothetical protein AMPC_31120 [Anaeromyxobacter paludicola]